MTEKLIGRGLSFDDVLIVPQLSDIESRYAKDLDLSSEVAKGAPKINVPLVSANMDTVTESRMAIAMAQYGGLGVIHRFMTPERQADEVKLVKSQMTTLETEPVTLPENATVADAKRVLNQKQRGYVVVTPSNGAAGEFLGIATTRDLRFATKDHDPISRVMTSKPSLHSVPLGTTLEEAVAIMKTERIEKIPVLRPDGTLAGLFTLKDFELLQQYPNASMDASGRLMVAAAIGVKESDLDRAHKLEAAEVDILVLDIAHGGLRLVENMLHTLKVREGIKKPIIAGNVATKETTTMLVNSGADGVKIGVGPGFVCETRDVAGAGMPQVTAVMFACEAMAKLQNPVPVMADGGIRKPGDVAKAVAAGADTVMVGSLFAGTPESPGLEVEVDGRLNKSVRGMASKGAHELRQRIEGNGGNEERVPEGTTKLIPIKKSVRELLFKLEGGLRSGMSYSGAHTILEMHEKAQFVEVSQAGASEQHRSLK